MKKESKIALFAWDSFSPYWKGWHGIAGIFRDRVSATEYLRGINRVPFSTSNTPRSEGAQPISSNSNKAQLVDYVTMKVIANYEKKEGNWSEVRKG